MCKFKSALIAKYKDDIKLFWKVDEDSHSELSKLLGREFGWPEEACPIEVTGGKIVMDMEKTEQKSWMKKYVEKHKEQILEIEKKTLEWMKTHELDLIDITHSDGFVMPKESKIKRVLAAGSKNLTFEGPIVAEYLDVSYTDGFLIPEGSRIEELDAVYSEKLTFEDDCKIGRLYVEHSSGMIIPSTCKIGRKYV